MINTFCFLSVLIHFVVFFIKIKCSQRFYFRPWACSAGLAPWQLIQENWDQNIYFLDPHLNFIFVETRMCWIKSGENPVLPKCIHSIHKECTYADYWGSGSGCRQKTSHPKGCLEESIKKYWNIKFLANNCERRIRQTISLHQIFAQTSVYPKNLLGFDS